MARISSQLFVLGGLFKPAYFSIALLAPTLCIAASVESKIVGPRLDLMTVSIRIQSPSGTVPNNPQPEGPESFLLSAHSRILPSRRRLGRRKVRRRS